MNNTITVKPNQSMLDVIIQGCGTMEGGMQMMAQNTGRSISDTPNVGDVILVNSVQPADPGTLQYLQQNNIVIGTLGTSAPGPHECTVILYPVMHGVKNPVDATTPPGILGFWDLLVVSDNIQFVCVNGLAAGVYPTDPNPVGYLSLTKLLDGFTPVMRADTGSPLMADKDVNYQIPYNTFSMSGPVVVVESAYFVDGSVNTMTFEDTAGNEAMAAPLIILDGTSQAVVSTLLPTLHVAVVSVGAGGLNLRLTRSHASSGYSGLGAINLSWAKEATPNTPDPLDPTNANKAIVFMPWGTHTFAVQAQYIYSDMTTVLGNSLIDLVVVVS